MTDQIITGLLSSGGDGRLTLSEDGLNRYGCRFEPEPGTLQLGSCTASTVSAVGFDVARRVYGRVTDRSAGPGADTIETEYADIRRRLAAAVVPASDRRPDVVLVPSGTDAEYVPLLLALADERRVTNIVTAPTEVGSGSVPAAELRHFDGQTPSGERVVPGEPIDPALTARVNAVNISVRDDDGVPLDPDVIDQRARRTVDAAIRAGDTVLLHVVAHSKTGVHAPSLEYVWEAAAEHGDRVHVVVDAAQGRISRRGLAEALDHGWSVIITGSKFFGGPPFAGAVLVPARYRARVATLPFPDGLGAYFSAWQIPEFWTGWRESAPQRDDLGVLLRWSAAMAEIEGYYAFDDSVRFRILRAFETAAIDVLTDTPGIELEDVSTTILDNEEARLLQSKHTVFSFALHAANGHRLDAGELRRVQRTVRSGEARPEDPHERRPARAQTGQPVTVAADGRSVLRIALGAPLLRRYADPAIGDPHAEIAADLDFVARWLRQAAG